MAWKRGVKNNQEGAIQKGHIREFLLPSSRSTSVHADLKVVHIKDIDVEGSAGTGIHAYISDREHGKTGTDVFLPFVQGGSVYLHAHEHARSVLSVVMHPAVLPGCIVLNDSQLVNSKVCTGETHRWTVYQGESYTYDAREGAIGDTAIRSKGSSIPLISNVIMHIRRQEGLLPASVPRQPMVLDGSAISQSLAKKLFMTVLTVDDVFITSGLVTLDDTLVCRVAEIQLEDELESEDPSSDEYRGMFGAGTKVYVVAENKAQDLDILNILERPKAATRRDEVHVITSDEEQFPVLRRLLRPCITLTSVVQAAYGKYKTLSEAKTDTSADDAVTDKETPTFVRISVDACTFDRVLLYLEHVDRGESFCFDPLIANDLLAAANSLGILALSELCEKVLGSFKDRVRKTPIRYEEVIARNKAGTEAARISDIGKRSDTWLILNGMVLDVSRWLEEHPGGSSIIPEQALNKDCTVFFEIYHASRQSFLYLKEFYIGELCTEDIAALPTGREIASSAFMDELERRTSWRLKPEDMILTEVHKSF